MITPGVLALAATMIIAAGLLVGIGGRVALLRLPEPAVPDDADPDLRAEYTSKIAYRTLATPQFGVITGFLGAMAMIITVLAVPPPFWGCWFVLSTVAVLLAAVDALTTWLPRTITYAGWPAMAVAIILGLPFSDHPVPALIAILGSAAVAGLAYLLLWLVTGGRGVAFGDVRLMPLIGAVAGTMGWSGLYWSVLFGSICGALIGAVRLILRRRGAFPYAPALVAGPYAAAILLAFLR
jgi:leader peptidase (prepilin peptidase)/N-methyltransferase